MKTYRCHLVSQLLLNQFAKNGKIRVFNKFNQQTSLKYSKDIAYLELPREYFDKIETKWSRKIEQKVGNLIQKYTINNSRLYMDDDSIGILKKFMALSFVRNIMVMSILAEISIDVEKKLLKGVPIEYHEKIKNDWRTKILSSSPNIVDSIYTKIAEDLKQYTVELGFANRRNKFKLGDVPVINTMKDESGITYVGIKNGVSFKQSETFILPISPLVAISICKKKKIWSLRAKDIRKINQKIKDCSIYEYYSIPD